MKTIAGFVLFATMFACYSCREKQVSPEVPGLAPASISTELSTDETAITVSETAKPAATTHVPVILQQLLNELYEAGGDFRWKKPAIELVDSDNFVATFRPRSNKILIEQKVLAICRSFGKDSSAMLAFLIGHELTHFYQNEGAKTAGSTNFLAFHKAHDADIQSEVSADLQGIFLTYIAGYQRIQDCFPELIDRIYINYQLNSKQLEGYPEKQERQEFARVVRQRSDTLFHVFQAATYLSGFGKYREATACYNYLLQFYRGCEIYNNLGVLYALQAMKVGGKNADTLWYPLELDIHSRLSEARAGPLTATELGQRNELLEMAIVHFERSRNMNPWYQTAQVNRFCALLLLGQYDLVLKEIENPGTAIDKDLKGLLTALAYTQREEMKAEALALFEKLENINNKQVAALAKLNAASLRGQQVNVQSPKCSLPDMDQYPDGTKLRDLRMTGGFSLDEEASVILQWHDKTYSTLFLLNDGGDQTSFQVIHSPAVSLDPQLKVGLAFSEEHLKPAQKLFMPARLGNFWYASPCKMVINSNRKGKIEAWAVKY